MAKAEKNAKVLEIPDSVAVDCDCARDKDTKAVPIRIVVDFTQATPQDVLDFAVRTAVINQQATIRRKWRGTKKEGPIPPKEGEVFSYSVKAAAARMPAPERVKREVAKIASAMSPEERAAFIQQVMDEMNES